MVLNVETGLVGHLDGGCWGQGRRLVGEVLLNEHLLSVLVDPGLGSGDEEGSHDEEVECG